MRDNTVHVDDLVARPRRRVRSYPAPRQGVAAAPNAEVTVDMAILSRMLDDGLAGNLRLLAEIIDTYLEGAVSNLSALRDAAARADRRALMHAAHALKGSSGQLGVRGVQALAARLEDLGGADSLAGAAGLVEELDAELGRARVVLLAERRRVEAA